MHAFIHSINDSIDIDSHLDGAIKINLAIRNDKNMSIGSTAGNTSGNNDNINNKEISDNCLILRENVATNVVFFCSSFSNKILWHGSETGRQTNDTVSEQPNKTGISVLRLDFNAALRVNKWINSMHHRLRLSSAITAEREN